MPANVRVGGARVDFSADAGGYLTTLRQVESANRGLGVGYAAIGRGAARQTRFIDQFTNSLRSSLIATVAYAAGVNAVRLAISGSVGGAIAYDRALIRIQKTTDITGDRLLRLGDRIRDINTRATEGARAFGVSTEALLATTEALGNLGIRGEDELVAFTRAAAALDIASSDLSSLEAVDALGRLRSVLVDNRKEADQLASAIARVGRETVGGEGRLARFVTRISQEVAGRGGLPTDFIFGLASAFQSGGAREESASTVVGRLVGNINELVGDENLGRFRLLGEIAGSTREEIDSLAESIRNGTGGVEANREAFDLLIEAYGRLPEASEDALSRGDLRRLLFGEDNVRTAAAVGILAKNYEVVASAAGVANVALENQSEHLDEARQAAESFSDRLVVVGNEIGRQGESFGSILAPALAAGAENFRIFEVAAIGAGTALISNFGRRRFEAFRASNREYIAGLNRAANASTTFTRQEEANLARVLAANRARAQVGGLSGVQQLGLIEREQAARRGVARATLLQSRAVAQLSARQRILNRITRAGAATLGFFGGPLGAILTALSLGASAFLLFGNNASDAADGVESLDDRLSSLAARLQTAEQTAGLTAEGAILAEVDAEIDRIEARAKALRAFVETIPASLRRRGLGARQEDEVDEIVERLETLQADREAVFKALEVTIRGGGEETADIRLPSFEPAILSLEVGTRQVRDFYRALVDGSEAAVRAARTEASVAGETPLVQMFTRLQNAELEQIRGQRRTLSRAFEDAQDNLRRARAIVDVAEEDASRFLIGTQDRTSAERQSVRARAQVQEQERLLRIAQERLEASQGLGVNEERLLAVARERVLTENALVLAERPVVVPDLIGADESAREFVDQLRLQIEGQLRDLEQSRVVDAVFSPATQAELEARFAAQNAFTDQQRTLSLALTRARRAQTDAELRLVEALRELEEAGANATDQQRELVSEIKQEAAATRASTIEAEANVAALESRGDAYRDLAEQAAEAAKQIQMEAERAPSFLENVETVGVSAIEGLASAITDFERIGSQSFKDWAGNVVQSLIDVLTQVIIVDNAVAALRTVLDDVQQSGGGSGGGSGFFSFLTGLFGGGGAPAFAGAPSFHSGGVVPRGAPGARETLALVEHGEEVLTRNDPRHRYNIGAQSSGSLREWVSRLPRFHDGGVVGGDAGSRNGSELNVRVEIINELRGDVEAVDNGQRIDINGLVTSIILRDRQSRGPITQAFMQR